MVAFYKHHIPDWMDGTENLDHATYRVYHVIVQLIYLNEGPIANNEHGIAGRCKTSARSYRACLETLLRLGKLTLEDGRIDNRRACQELHSVGENRANAAKGGARSLGVPKARPKPLQNNDRATAPLFATNSLKEKTREEKTREDKTQEIIDSESAPNGAGTFSSITAETAPEQPRVLGNYDFLSDDGSVLILADEFKALESELLAIKSVRALVRHSCRSWLLEIEPSQRKEALLRWLRKKNTENEQRQSVRKRGDAKECARRAVEADVERRKQADKALAVQERLNREHQLRMEARRDQIRPGGELSPPQGNGSH
ncbi:uncharacterized protein YdaU (DUF1376 family) [Bradyrhizobium ottawaense]|uniref:DUF1376 domain-containing protein n=1 Tax=Bradyrhizobium ottawaense TaxID=931866 RepID=UPI0038372DCC